MLDLQSVRFCLEILWRWWRQSLFSLPDTRSSVRAQPATTWDLNYSRDSLPAEPKATALHFPLFFQSAFADKIKQLRASVLMESSYLPPYWKAFGNRCSFNTRWTSSCCAISEDLKTSKALCWLHVAGDCVAKYVGSSVNVLEARLRLVPLLYKDASIILGLLGWWTGAFSTTNHSCCDGFLWIFSSVITPLWIAHVPLSSTYKCFGSSSAAEGLQSLKDWRAAHTWSWSITVDLTHPDCGLCHKSQSKRQLRIPVTNFFLSSCTTNNSWKKTKIAYYQNWMTT